MFGWLNKPPLDREGMKWVDRSMGRLDGLFDKDRVNAVKVICPSPEFFPDAYEASEKFLSALVARICGYLEIEPSIVDLRLIVDTQRELQEMLPAWRNFGDAGAAGTYQGDAERHVIAVHEGQLSDPTGLVAVIAHELAHLLLLGKYRMEKTEDMEPLTDLATVYLGFGIFSANAAARFRQTSDSTTQGWSLKRLGYLSQQTFGYALARFACRRGESKPGWIKYLSTNSRSYFKESMRFLEKTSAVLDRRKI
jgi:hypothetical protein